MTLSPKSFAYTVDPATAVATITLNRPDRLNALTFEVYTELRDTFRALDTEPGVRAVIITGTGRAFCSGGTSRTSSARCSRGTRRVCSSSPDSPAISSSPSANVGGRSWRPSTEPWRAPAP